jgi:amino acid permease
MGEKEAVVADAASSTPPPAENKTTGGAYTQGQLSTGGAVLSDNFYTRNGLNWESFKMRDYGHGIVELDRTMKKRHLHMIAIGKLFHPMVMLIAGANKHICDQLLT